MSLVLPSPPERTVNALASATTVTELLHATCQELVDLLDAAACAISRVIGDVLIDVAQHPRLDQRLQLGRGFLISEFPVTRDVLEDGQPRLVSLLDVDPDPQEAMLLRESGLESLLMLRLLALDQAWGLVEIYHTGGKRFRDEDPALAESIVERAGTLLEPLLGGAAERAR
jgi:GAF domain-containing protein